MFHHFAIIVLLAAAYLTHTSEALPHGGSQDVEWPDVVAAGRFRRQAQGFGGQGFGGQGFGGQQGIGGGQGGANGGYGIKNWYNTPEGWGYDATYPGGETHFHSKRGGGGQQGGFGAGRGGSY